MELLEGKALRDSIAHRPLATEQLLELAAEIADLVKGADIWDGLAQTPPEPRAETAPCRRVRIRFRRKEL
jgi:hypothetical protein